MRRPTQSPTNSTSTTSSLGYKSYMSSQTLSRRRVTEQRMRRSWTRSAGFWRTRSPRRVRWQGTSARGVERPLRTKLTPQSSVSRCLCLAKMQQPRNKTSIDRTQHSGVSKLELQVRYTTTLWGWMHDMRYDLPPQKKWPHGVHPPGNASAVATPTMEKLATQGNHPVEQNEVGLRANEKTRMN